MLKVYIHVSVYVIESKFVLTHNNDIYTYAVMVYSPNILWIDADHKKKYIILKQMNQKKK